MIFNLKPQGYVEGMNNADRVRSTKTRKSLLETKEIVVVSNTKQQSIQRKYWIFTIGKSVETDSKRLELTPDDIIAWAKSCGASRYVFQLEQGIGGYVHYQGFLELRVKRRLEELKKGMSRAHLEPSRSAAASDYCKKVETRLDGPWSWPYEYQGEDLPVELYEWQWAILKEIEGKPIPRRVTWIWSNEGNIGKSKFCKYLMFHHGAQLVGGNRKDAAFAVTNAGKVEKPIYLIDLERSRGNDIDYSMLEQLSNGSFFSPKYESVSYIGPEPFIFVFANMPPETEKLSADRWVIIELKRERDCLKRRGYQEAALRGPEPLRLPEPLKRADAIIGSQYVNWD